METINTEICKEALDTIFKGGGEKWKRIKKCKVDGKTVREFARGDGAVYKVISDNADTEIEKIEKKAMEAAPVELRSFNDILRELKGLDKSLRDYIREDFANCEDGLEEYLRDNDQSITIELDVCLEWIEDRGFKNKEKGTEALMKHLKKVVPADFPFNLRTEDYVWLWKASTRPPLLGIEKIKAEAAPAGKSVRIESMEDFFKAVSGEGYERRKESAEEYLKKLAEEVTEEGKKFSGMKTLGNTKVPAGKYQFCIIRCSPQETSGENNWFVLINPTEYWRKEECLCDSYTSRQYKEIYAVCDEIGLTEEMESHFISKGKKSVAQIRQILLDRGFYEDSGFIENMEKCYYSGSPVSA